MEAKLQNIKDVALKHKKHTLLYFNIMTILKVKWIENILDKHWAQESYDYLNVNKIRHENKENYLQVKKIS
jgi:hypothetical protein